MIRGPLFGFLLALITAFVVLGIIYVVDIVLHVLGDINREIAGVFGVEPSTSYSQRADEAAASLAIIFVASILFIIVVFTVYLKRR